MKFVRTIALLLFYLYPLTTAQAQEAKENKADSLKHNNSLTAQPIPGTEAAVGPSWSPDSQQIAFAEDGKLEKISVSGGTPQTLCDIDGVGITWNRNGVILFSQRRQSLPRARYGRRAGAGGCPGRRAQGGCLFVSAVSPRRLAFHCWGLRRRRVLHRRLFAGRKDGGNIWRRRAPAPSTLRRATCFIWTGAR